MRGILHYSYIKEKIYVLELLSCHCLANCETVVGNESDSIAEAGHWAGKALEAGVGRWIWVGMSVQSEAEGLGESSTWFWLPKA